MKKKDLVLKRCCDVLGVTVEELYLLKSLEDLNNWDSLKQIQLITVLEDGLGYELTLDDIASLTPQSIATLVEDMES